MSVRRLWEYKCTLWILIMWTLNTVHVVQTTLNMHGCTLNIVKVEFEYVICTLQTTDVNHTTLKVQVYTLKSKCTCRSQLSTVDTLKVLPWHSLKSIVRYGHPQSSTLTIVQVDRLLLSPSKYYLNTLKVLPWQHEPSHDTQLQYNALVTPHIWYINISYRPPQCVTCPLRHNKYHESETWPRWAIANERHWEGLWVTDP